MIPVPHTITFCEKHEPRTFVCPTPAHALATFLMVLTERVEQGWYDAEEPRYKTTEEVQTLERETAAELAKLSNRYVAQFAERELPKQVEELLRRITDYQDFQDARAIVAAKDGAKAREFMLRRRNQKRQYEGFRVEVVNTVEP